MDEILKMLDEKLEYISHEIVLDTIYINAVSNLAGVECPKCKNVSFRVHAYYEKTFQDPPIQGKKVKIILRNRKMLYMKPEKIDGISIYDINSVFQLYPVLPKLYELVDSFKKLLFEKKFKNLSKWIKKAEKLDIDEIKSFLNGISMDIDGVKNAIKYKYSNGLAEGKIKVIKRIMYGRSSFAYLRRKILELKNLDTPTKFGENSLLIVNQYFVEEQKLKFLQSKFDIIELDRYYDKLRSKGSYLMGELNVKIEDLLTPEQLKQHKLRMEYNDNNMNGFSMPIKVDKDSEYVNSLTQNLNRYYDYIQNKPAFNKEPNLVNDIEKTNSKLIKAVQNYYNGNITEAKRDVKHILKKFRKDDSENFFISELDKSYAFRGVAPFESLKAEHGEEEHYRKMNEVPLSFFRARTGSVSRREEMLHVPFDKRGLISTQRFSIAGIPCMYFGTTSYGCWIELDKPANKDFNVASYKFNESGKGLKILNLVLSEPLINGIFNRGMDSEDSIRKKLQIKMIKLFPIVIATSFRVLEQGRSFKSEYIISQLIMHCLKELKIDGVAYLSKKGKDDFQYPHGVNLAIPVFEKCKNEKFGEVCNNFSLTNPFNYESFLNLKEKDYGELSYINRIYKEKTSYGHDNFNSKVNFNQDSVFYGSLSFSDFDNYLVNREHLTQQI